MYHESYYLLTSFVEEINTAIYLETKAILLDSATLLVEEYGS